MEWDNPLHKVSYQMSKCVSFSKLITMCNKTKPHPQKSHHHTDWLKVVWQSFNLQHGQKLFIRTLHTNSSETNSTSYPGYHSCFRGSQSAIK